MFGDWASGAFSQGQTVGDGLLQFRIAGYEREGIGIIDPVAKLLHGWRMGRSTEIQAIVPVVHGQSGPKPEISAVLLMVIGDPFLIHNVLQLGGQGGAKVEGSLFAGTGMTVRQVQGIEQMGKSKVKGVGQIGEGHQLLIMVTGFLLFDLVRIGNGKIGIE